MAAGTLRRASRSNVDPALRPMKPRGTATESHPERAMLSVRAILDGPSMRAVDLLYSIQYHGTQSSHRRIPPQVISAADYALVSMLEE
jgi:hypothetical protein